MLILKNWCLWTVALEKTLESPLDGKEIKWIKSKGNQPWIFIGRTDADVEAEAAILWPPDAKSRLMGKDPDAGKDWRQEENGTMENRWLNGIIDSMDMSLSNLWEMGEGQGSLACCSPWGHKELDMTEPLNNYNRGVKKGFPDRESNPGHGSESAES